MTIYDQSQYRPPYPKHNEKGIDPEPQPFGPPDLRPSGLGPGYSVYASAHGRNLAGMDDNNFDSQNSEGIETYPNELDLLNAADDVNGNGLFDPHGSHGNVHPDAGVFQDHLNIPGYIDRDQFYHPSEVRDLTQPGHNVMYVPGGAVSFQDGQKETYEKQQALWEIPPGMGWKAKRPPEKSIVDAPTATWPVSGLRGGDDAEKAKQLQYYMLAAGAGLAVGLAAVYMMRRK